MFNRIFRSSGSEGDATRNPLPGGLSDPSEIDRLTEAGESPEIRQAAILRCTNPELLGKLSAAPGEESRAALDRLTELLAGEPTESLSLEQLLTAVNCLQQQSALCAVATRSSVTEVRVAAVRRLTDREQLAQVLRNDPAFKVKSSAVEQLSCPETLRHLLTETRKDDKRLTRVIKQRLQELEQSVEAEQRIQQKRLDLCQRAEAAQIGESDLERRIKQFEFEWGAVAGEPDAELAARFERAITALRQLCTAPAPGEEQLVPPVFRQLALLRQTIENESESLDLAAIREQMRELHRQWHAAPIPERWREPFVRDYEISDSLIGQIEIRRQRIRARQKVCQRLLQALSSDKPPTSRQIEQLERDIAQLPAAEELPTADPAEEPAQLLERLRQRVESVNAKLDSAARKLGESCDRLEQELDAGEFAEAFNSFRKLQQRLADERSLPTGVVAPIRKRMAKIAPRIHELQEWRQWANVQERGILCQKVAALIASDLDPARLATEIRAARDAWRDLDHREGTTGREWWDKFNELCNKAYEPCQAHFDALNQEREHNLRVREQICTDFELLMSATDWDAVEDWHALFERVKKLNRRWQSAGPVDRKKRKGVEKRFARCSSQAETALAAEQQRNHAARVTLIEQLEALQGEEHLNTALNELRRLRSGWHTTVPGKRKTEQQLWKRFKAACDAVYARQNERQERQKEEQRQLGAEAEALIGELQALTPESVDNLDEISRQANALKRRWQGLGQRLPAGAVKRFREAEQALHAAISQIRNRAREAELEQLRSAAGLCVQAESRAMGWGDEYSQLPDFDTLHLPDSAAKSQLAARYERALEGAFGKDDLERNRETLETLCIRAEILAGIDSPAEAGEARMAYQVSRLSSALKGTGAEIAPDTAHSLWLEWLQVGVVEPELRNRLTARFRQAMATISG